MAQFTSRGCMREALKRLERLEARTPDESKPFRLCVQFIGFDEEWNPARAWGAGGEIERDPSESVAAFEARAAERFPFGLRFMA